MIRSFFLLIFLIFFKSYSQENKENVAWLKENYVSINNVGVNGIYDSRFGNESESKIKKGVSFEAVSLHGLFFFDYISFSLGLGVNYNTIENYAVLPVLADLRIYLNEKGLDDSFFAFLQMGKNIEVDNVFLDGRPVKLGVGSTFQKNDEFQLVLEVFKKYEEAFIPGEDFRFDVSSYGVSLGLKF